MFEITYCLNCGKDLNTLIKDKKYCNLKCEQEHNTKEEIKDIPIKKEIESNVIIKDRLRWMFKGKEMLTIPNTRATGFIYLITQKSTGRQYIGQKSFYIRMGENWLYYLTSSVEVKKLIERDITDFDAEVLQLGYSKKQLNYLERKYIDEYGTKHLGFNKN